MSLIESYGKPKASVMDSATNHKHDCHLGLEANAKDTLTGAAKSNKALGFPRP
ncbi:hypothetical protein RO3G_12140 [Rhizopus delemar RA 99-880]|uniref:Uncharacterized protein n=1 Tax=Rhizopus delemar (strain RA 99-880 / ATCC MYA-4621 / FGSC 9543 / NRRL 43880) TaxID=246409 RepID=I1CG49_RHIO9|nr:hypothetical protein RO3G_12140 [Rhizopus delemar RA 99-880]|eukprot:EIE87429.1 hypothetical protein RO3G_12140 [Rhizopus delemar RA 99-880]